MVVAVEVAVVHTASCFKNVLFDASLDFCLPLGLPMATKEVLVWGFSFTLTKST